MERDLNDAEYSFAECKDAYNPVIDELLSQEDCDTPIEIRIVKDGNNGNSYYDVHAVDEIAHSGEKASLGGMAWREISSATIVDAAGLDQLNQVAQILWELTYDGWSEKDHKDFVEKVKGLIDNV